MFFWFRELIGWALLAVALYLISIALQFVETRKVIEASVVVFASLTVMRAGILLIRMNTVARITQQNTPEISTVK
jgi:hypothetical protein